MASAAHEREKLERLIRYSTRPAVSTERLSLSAPGDIRYRLKTPCQDGTTDVVFEPLDLLARLATLVPTPRGNLTRYHGVFIAPNHWLREITRTGDRIRKMNTLVVCGDRGSVLLKKACNSGNAVPCE